MINDVFSALMRVILSCGIIAVTIVTFAIAVMALLYGLELFVRLFRKGIIMNFIRNLKKN